MYYILHQYYHWHPELLEIGDILHAGEYGQLIEKIDKISQQDKYKLEKKFEQYRNIYYSDKPSRLK